MVQEATRSERPVPPLYCRRTRERPALPADDRVYNPTVPPRSMPPITDRASARCGRGDARSTLTRDSTANSTTGSWRLRPTIRRERRTRHQARPARTWQSTNYSSPRYLPPSGRKNIRVVSTRPSCRPALPHQDVEVANTVDRNSSGGNVGSLRQDVSLMAPQKLLLPG